MRLWGLIRGGTSEKKLNQSPTSTTSSNPKMPWFSTMKLFGNETPMRNVEMPITSGVRYHTLYPLRLQVPKDIKLMGKPVWYKGGPYSVSPLPETPIPPLMPRIPRPAYLRQQKPPT
jgi:hypothetical protein